MMTLKELQAKYNERQGNRNTSYQIAWIKLFRACVQIEEGEMCGLLHAKKAFERTNPDYARMRVLEHVRDPDGRAGELLWNWVQTRMRKAGGVTLALVIEDMRRRFPRLTRDSMVYIRPTEEYQPNIDWRLP